MRFSCLKKRESLEYRIKDFSKGINTEEKPPFTENEALTKGKNIWFRDGLVQTRNGISPNGFELDCLNYDHSLIPFTVTGTSFYVNGKNCKVAYSAEFDGVSNVLLKSYLIDDDGEIRTIGVIELNRPSSEYFYMPENVLFISGNSKRNASGLYAFLYLNSAGNYGFRIFELSADLSTWEEIDNQDYYVPTVYINGKGNRYDEAVANDFKLTAKPERFEELNMISDEFRAYFTTDGYSNEFVLPVKNIVAGPIVCNLYSSANRFHRWEFGDSDVSATTEIAGVPITLRIDRTSGTLSFYDDYLRYPLPEMPNIGENNLVVTACKRSYETSRKIFSSKGAYTFGSKVYLYGNDIAPNEVYEGSLSNLLYFKNSLKTAVGGGSSRVTAMSSQNNKLIVFKENEVYKLNISARNDLSETVNLPEYSGDYSKNDKITAVLIHNSVGCDCPDTVRVCADKTIWANSSGEVYLLATTTYGKENNIYRISPKIEDELSTFSENDFKAAKAGDNFGHYMLFIKNKAFVFDYRIKGFGYSASYMGENYKDKYIGWFMWEFPKMMPEVAAIIPDNKRLNIIFFDREHNKAYKSEFFTERDTFFEYNGSNSFTRSFNVDYELSTRNLNLGSPHIKKEIKDICITATILPDVELIADFGKFKRGKVIKSQSRLLQSYRINPFALGIEYIKLNLKGSAPFELSDILISYKRV